MPIEVIDDLIAEPTETVTLTVDESATNLVGVASDTLFIFDDDTNGVHWISKSSTDWNEPGNWSPAVVPTSTDNAFFDIPDTVSCVNAGDGLSSLAGLFVRGPYAATVTLANPLSVGTLTLSARIDDDVYSWYLKTSM